MKTTALSQRERLTHKKIVQRFVTTACPVSSQYIARDRDLNVSPATVRNTMAKLEYRGYIRQPHTSAGRIPTDTGYRYYVDSLMDAESLSAKNRETIEDVMYRTSLDVNEIIEQACLTLGLVSQQLGVALTPRFLQGIFHKLELYTVAESKVLLVLTMKSGLVKTVIARIQSRLSPRQLEETARIVSERLSGLTLQQIKDSIQDRIKDTNRAHPQLLRVLLRSLDRLLDARQQERIFWKGTDHIVAQPEFSHPQALGEFFGFLEDGKAVQRVLRGLSKAQGIQIRIGHENPPDTMSHCSVVVAPYSTGMLQGAIGVIGPTRMPYSKVVSLVDYMGKLLSRMLRV